MNRRPLVVLALAVLVLWAAVAAPARARPRSVATAASPQVVAGWNATGAATLLASGKPQPESMIYIGLTQAAVYDAVIAIEGGFEPYLIVPAGPPGPSRPAGAA